MRSLHLAVVVVVALLASRLAAQSPSEIRVDLGHEPPVLFLRVEGALGPPTARFVAEGIHEAQRLRAAALVLELDTPGGLDASMREMIGDILASPVPVVVWVSPRGARAASAGTFLVYASHVAAMAPATNLGAATPVAFSGASSQGQKPDAAGREARDPSLHKAESDAAATIRGLAELRGRDPVFAEAAVREAASLSSSEALERGVIDIVAADRTALLQALDGRTVHVAGDVGARVDTAITIDVDHAPIIDVQPRWQTRVLSVLANPNVAYLLLIFGFYGILFELSSPGSVLPGVAGAISLLLGLFALQLLPVSYAGVALVALGFALMIAESFAPSFGALGVGGLVSLVVGSLLLVDVQAPAVAISRPLIAGVAFLSAGFVLGVLRLALRARHRPVVSGREQMIGSVAVATSSFDDRGAVAVHGEVWDAASSGPLQQGQAADVVDVEGLLLRVRPRPQTVDDAAMKLPDTETRQRRGAP